MSSSSISPTSIFHLTVYLNSLSPSLPTTPPLICPCFSPPSRDTQNDNGCTNSRCCVPDLRWYQRLRGQWHWRPSSSHSSIGAPPLTLSLQGPPPPIPLPPLRTFSKANPSSAWSLLSSHERSSSSHSGIGAPPLPSSLQGPPTPIPHPPL